MFQPQPEYPRRFTYKKTGLSTDNDDDELDTLTKWNFMPMKSCPFYETEFAMTQVELDLEFSKNIANTYYYIIANTLFIYC